MLNVSINSLLSNPLLPEMSIDKIGQHNYLIDIFVAMGLLLGITFIFFLLERIKRPLRYLSNQTKPYYWLCVLVLLVMGFTKNFFLLFPVCCIAPMLFIVYNNNIVKYNDSQSIIKKG